ncbi:DNA-binding transcriptional LysR family regulator [Lactobacillus colini]|uniref:DNA-binding transcriptional LysR family regulator n=1 Tax=Lactobacillus colini TaxID=1819254 RepID=A0ABS4MFM8_9LACO|nr:LysR family transcriptional regulator [Lactobacillus colini]MBP2058491.1 DNA-binding transcriptional LysR family regulator [Lactobacillus colini]
MVTLLKLGYFIDVVELSSFTKAAQKNYVAQTSISQQIKELEKDYSCMLINRTNTTPTEAGKVLYQHAKIIQSKIMDLDNAMEGFTGNGLNIAYTSLLDVSWLIKIFSKSFEFQNNLNIKKINMSEVTPGLQNGRFDLAVTFDSEFQNDKEIVTIPLQSGAYSIAVDQDHPLAKYSNVNIADVYKYSWVMLSPKDIGKSFKIMEERSHNLNLKPKIKYFADNIESEIFLIQRSNLIGFFPENYPVESISKRVKLIKIKKSPHTYKIVAAFPKNGKVSKNKNLMRILKETSM